MAFKLQLKCPTCGSENIVDGPGLKVQPDDLNPVCADCGHTLTEHEVTVQAEAASADKFRDLFDG